MVVTVDNDKAGRTSASNFDHGSQKKSKKLTCNKFTILPPAAKWKRKYHSYSQIWIHYTVLLSWSRWTFSMSQCIIALCTGSAPEVKSWLLCEKGNYQILDGLYVKHLGLGIYHSRRKILMKSNSKYSTRRYNETSWLSWKTLRRQLHAQNVSLIFAKKCAKWTGYSK